MRNLAFAAAFVFVTGAAMAADAPKVTAVPVFRGNTTITGQPIVVPDKPDVAVSIATFPPGATLPEHQHPYPHYVYVLEGVLTVVNTQTDKTFEVKAGAFIAEMQSTWHYGVNKGSVPVKLLIIDQVPAGTTSNVVPKAQ
ncbi:MAG: cupin domain-containing protein [Rhizomicrobium sp.]